MGFRSYVRHFRGAILGLLCPSKFVAAAKGKRSQKNHFLSVSEVTLGIFGVQFWRFSVLQRHGVSLPGGDFFHGVFPSEDQQQQQQKPLQQQAEKVARIHSSSKRKKKQPKSSFHHHFLWVSEVTLGICREVIFSMVCSHPRTSQQQQKPLQQQAEKVARIHSSSKRGKKAAKSIISSSSHHFLWVSKVTLGIFEVQFWGFSVLQRHGVLLPGGDFFHGVFPFGDRM